MGRVCQLTSHLSLRFHAFVSTAEKEVPSWLSVFVTHGVRVGQPCNRERATDGQLANPTKSLITGNLISSRFYSK